MKETMKEQITVREFCLKRTQVGELCVFRDCGYITGATWIDHEDLFTMSDRIKKQIVKSHEWGTIQIVTEHGDHLEIPCHYINF